jgi:tetratricopeptide (TPR) repeat protein
MKKLNLILILIALSIMSFAQRKEVTSAWSYLKDGFLDDAKKSIDKAELNAQTKDWYKTHYYKGIIYQELGNTQNKKYKALCNGCLDISYDAYLKSIKLNFTDTANRDIKIETTEGFMQFVKIVTANNPRDFEDSQALLDIIGNRFHALSNSFVNQGVNDFKDNKFEEAYSSFEKAMNIASLSFQADTQLIYFTSLAAIRSEKYKEAIELNDVLIKLNYGIDDDEKVSIFLNQAQSYAHTGDTTKMLSILESGISKFPNNNYPLVIETFNYYVNKDEKTKALEYINMAIEKNSTDPQFFVIKGTLLEEMKHKEEAQKEYENAIKIDPNNFDANYSLGAFLYNNAFDTLDWMNENVPIGDFAKEDMYKKIANELFEKALPYLQKTYEQQPTNINVLNTLSTIYYRLGKTDECMKIKGELDALIKKDE